MADNNPYKQQASKAFWRPAVAEVHFSDIAELWQPMLLKRSDKVATAGSCFAQHIGNNLAQRGANFMDMEPAPPLFSNIAEARRWGYGVFSCRYGNLYTTRQLVQLFDEAHGVRLPCDRVWKKGERYFDALRPGIDPVGQASASDVIALRELHLQKVREMFASLDIFIYTMGLTEGWVSREDGTMFPMAPGTVAGCYDSQRYAFHNLRHHEILADIHEFWERLKSVNQKARMLLTVSPVPLTATASTDHVLVATMYSKSVLRAVAGEMAADHEDIHYFPSYEIISAHASRGMFFNPDLRTVNDFGVKFVMHHFFSGELAKEFTTNATATQDDELDLICDEEILDPGEEGVAAG